MNIHAFLGTLLVAVIKALLREIKGVHTELKVILLHGIEPLRRGSVKTLRIFTLILLLINFNSFDTQSGLKLWIPS